MTLALVLFLIGTLVVYAGWTNKNVKALISGDNTVSK